MAVVVARRTKLGRQQADHDVVRRHETIGADQLVVARERRIARAAAAELARRAGPCRRRRGIRGAVRIRIGIRGVLRPDARIEDANHDARSAPLIAQRMQHFGADEGGAAVRVELQQFIAIDLLHARQSTQGRDVLLRHDHRNAAHHQIQVMNDSRRRQRSSDGGCKRAPLFGQLRELASCGRRRHVDLPQTVCAQRRAGDRGDRVARELDDDWNHRAASPTLVEVRRTYRSRRLQCSAGRPQLCGRFLRRN